MILYCTLGYWPGQVFSHIDRCYREQHRMSIV